MQFLVRMALTAVTSIMVASGAGAQTSDAQRICLADSTPADQKLVTCSSIITNAPSGGPQVPGSVYISRGNAYLSKKQFDRAIADFDQASNLNPKDVVSWITRGNAYREMGRFDRALQDYDRAIEIDPRSINAYFGRALTFQEKGRYDFDAFLNEGSFEDRAIADYSKLLQIDPGGAGSYSNRGILYQRERKYSLAIADFTQAIQLRPTNPIYIKNRAFAYIMTRQYDLAIADYRKALTLNVDAATRKQLGTALNELGISP
jgi:tetratricopeptide (TPR) repeat protein